MEEKATYEFVIPAQNDDNNDNTDDYNSIKTDPESIAWRLAYATHQHDLIIEKKAIGIEEHNIKNCGTTLCLVIEIGENVRGIIPALEVDEEMEGLEDNNIILQKLRQYIGQNLSFKIDKIDRNNNICYLSRKKAITEKQFLAWKEIEVGQVKTATVRKINAYQAKISIDGIYTILPAKEMSYNWVYDARSLYTIGDRLQVKIMAVDYEKKTLQVSVKPLLQDHWDFVPKKYAINGEYLGKITGIEEYGVFINLEGNVDALLPLPRLEDICKKMKIGQETLFRITNIDYDKRFIQGRIIRIFF